MKSFSNLNRKIKFQYFFHLKPKKRAMNLQQYLVFTLSTQLSIQSLVNKPPLPISVVSGPKHCKRHSTQSKDICKGNREPPDNLQIKSDRHLVIRMGLALTAQNFFIFISN